MKQDIKKVMEELEAIQYHKDEFRQDIEGLQNSILNKEKEKNELLEKIKKYQEKIDDLLDT